MAENAKEYEKKEMSMAQRQIYILSLLSENPKGYTVEEIRARLNDWNVTVSTRTIKRDMEELSTDYAICEDERNGKSYFYSDKYTLKNIDLTMQDLVALAFAKNVLGEYDHLLMGKNAIEFIDKVVHESVALNQYQFKDLCQQIQLPATKGGNDDIVSQEIERTIQTAIDNKNKIEIEYYSYSSDETTKRVIHPYRLILLDSYLNVEAYCELRKEIRRFRLSRIESADVLDEHFEEIKQTQGDTFMSLSGTVVEDLELIFTGDSIRYVKEYEKTRARLLSNTEEGLYFYRRTAITADVISWVRGFGAEVKVKKPVWLAEQLKNEAKQILEKY
ncbi:MAG: WYL domain-containing protein [Lachnospiraceae bacterium]|nr:WYL domain-containing protein [Lachnospiraceae bacterium]